VSYRFTEDNQAQLLHLAARWADNVLGWSADSYAYGLVDAMNKIRVVAVLNNFRDRNADVHVATPGAMAPQMANELALFFYHAFEVRQLRRLTARIAVDNLPAQMLALRLGFQVEGREREGFRGKDCAIFAMLRDDCHWIDAVNSMSEAS
jgi:hypothetical protein